MGVRLVIRNILEFFIYQILLNTHYHSYSNEAELIQSFCSFPSNAAMQYIITSYSYVHSVLQIDPFNLRPGKKHIFE